MGSCRAPSDRLAETCDAIRNLDLRGVRDALIMVEGMPSDEADVAIAGYRQFLAFHAQHPDQPLAPPADADKAWHHHILDTRRYAADCQAIFGHFLHHDPAPVDERLRDGRTLLTRLSGSAAETGPCIGTALPGLNGPDDRISNSAQ